MSEVDLSMKSFEDIIPLELHGLYTIPNGMIVNGPFLVTQLQTLLLAFNRAV